MEPILGSLPWKSPRLRCLFSARLAAFVTLPPVYFGITLRRRLGVSWPFSLAGRGSRLAGWRIGRDLAQDGAAASALGLKGRRAEAGKEWWRSPVSLPAFLIAGKAGGSGMPGPQKVAG